MRDELPELITNTDFDVAITYALKLSGVRSILVRPTSSSQSRQASRRDSIRSQRVWMDGWMDGWMKKSTGSQQQAHWGIDRSMDQGV